MTVFKTFLKVLNKSKTVVITYTIMLIIFGGFNMQTSESSTTFVSSKPDIMIINKDSEEGITKNLVDYMTKNSNIKDIADNDEAISDALFYRDINYIIIIPENYREDFLNDKNPQIDVKTTGDYSGYYAEMMLERYIKVANTYKKYFNDEQELINKINETLSKQVDVQITSKLDSENLSKATFFYNFASYSLLAGCVYVICLILTSFKQEKIRKRTIISSMSYKKVNRQLLLSNMLFAIILWLAYVALSAILVKDAMFTTHGLIYILNSFVFTICAVSIAFLIANLVSDKNAINGIVNVVALGSSFLCGAFVPMQWLPDSVIKIAHILPTYYFISNNENITKLENINLETMQPILTNMGIVLIFAIGFMIITNIVSKKKQKIG